MNYGKLENRECLFICYRSFGLTKSLPVPVWKMQWSNRSFSSYLVSQFQNKFLCETFVMKISLHKNEPVGKARFHMKGAARGLILTQMQTGDT